VSRSIQTPIFSKVLEENTGTKGAIALRLDETVIPVNVLQTDQVRPRRYFSVQYAFGAPGAGLRAVQVIQVGAAGGPPPLGPSRLEYYAVSSGSGTQALLGIPTAGSLSGAGTLRTLRSWDRNPAMTTLQVLSRGIATPTVDLIHSCRYSNGNAAWAWSPQLGIELIPGPSTISQLALFSDTDNVSGQCILVFSQPALAV